MKKRLFALAMAAVIALVVVPLALAAGNNHGTAANRPAKGKPFLAKGTVVSVDVPSGTLLVTVARGSHNMKPFRTDVTFTLATRAHIFARTIGPHGRVHLKRTTLDQVTPGSKVNINGRVGRDATGATVFLARHIVVKLAPVPTPTPTDTPSPSAAPAF